MSSDAGIHAAARELAGILRRIVTGRFSTGNTIMFSGGLDSAVLALLLRERDVRLAVMGLDNSPDIRWAGECAGMLGMAERLDILTVGPDDVAASLDRVRNRHGITDPKYFSTFVCFDLVLERAPAGTLLCGQGADEIFGGYRKYLDAGPENAAVRMAADLEALRDREMPLYREMARYHDRELLAPYLEPEVVGFGLGLPAEWRASGGGKEVLRLAADILGLPPEIAGRSKKAMQYGSGVSRQIRKLLR